MLVFDWNDNTLKSPFEINWPLKSGLMLTAQKSEKPAKVTGMRGKCLSYLHIITLKKFLIQKDTIVIFQKTSKWLNYWNVKTVLCFIEILVEVQDFQKTGFPANSCMKVEVLCKILDVFIISFSMALHCMYIYGSL